MGLVSRPPNAERHQSLRSRWLSVIRDLWLIVGKQRQTQLERCLLWGGEMVLLGALGHGGLPWPWGER